jgi:glycosyltransferase involved in cell wall biosynthesis
MLLNRAYYLLKPMIPWSIRLALRRKSAARRRRAAEANGTWPIQKSAAGAPSNWPGWPGGKQFGVVLTHDVEGQLGMDRVSDLMRLEVELGFRSSFNFIPEGDYRVSKQLREEVEKNGFEVGVHDLNHDGKLYRSKAEFMNKARRINQYLKEWNAVGFRSGFMLRNLSWLGELNVKYEASTFDSDPFEPMPGGEQTIFPFKAPRAKGGSYLELPYTLCQDSTMFMFLGEKTPDIWKKKLDWLAANGGMALINVHPDYTHFGNGKMTTREFPADYYREFLQYIQDKYAGKYWHGLPRELADYCAPYELAKPNRRKKSVLMLSYSHYDSDSRILRYAESLANRGDEVDAVALQKFAGEGPHTLNGVNVRQLQSRQYNERGKFDYFYRVFTFQLRAFWYLFRNSRKYDLIHVHNIPDFLVLAALGPKVKGTKIILDIHDIVPEFYVSKFKVGENSLVIRALRWLERLSCRFSDHVIISNHLWYDKIVARSVEPRDCSVYINNVDSSVFYQRPRTRKDGKYIMLFPGGFQWHQGLDIAIRAFNLIKDKVPQCEFHLYGEGSAEADLKALVAELHLEKRVLFFAPRKLSEIAEIIADADLGVVPKRANSFGNEAYSTKIMEFMALGVPVVASRTKIDSFYFNDSVLKFFESGNVEDMADAMWTVISNQNVRDSLIRNGLKFAEENSWKSREKDYFGLVDSLTA